MADADVTYKYYRIYITKTPKTTYARIDRVKMFLSIDASGANILSSATATAESSGNYSGSTTATGALDSAGYWESNSSSVEKWLKITLGTAQPIRSIEFDFGSDVSETPQDFKIQASNDNVVWVDLVSFVDNFGRILKTALHLKLSGTSKLDTGDAAAKIFIHNFDTGDFIAAVIPSVNGDWQQSLSKQSNVMVTHIGPAGYPPQCDGPITPFSG